MVGAGEFGFAAGSFEGEAVAAEAEEGEAVFQEHRQGSEGAGGDEVEGFAERPRSRTFDFAQVRGVEESRVGGAAEGLGAGGDGVLTPWPPLQEWRGGGAAEGLGAGGDDVDVGEAEVGGGFIEEGGALQVGFDEGVGGVGAGDGEDEAGEAGAGADVGDALAGLDVAEQQRGKGIEEVLYCCMGGVGDGGEAVGAMGEEEGVVE